MATAWAIEPIYVFKDRDVGLRPRLRWPPPDQLSLDRLEERFDSCVVVTTTLATHRYREPMLATDLLVIM